MKYVDNLLECKPEEIQHCFDPTAIVAIVPTPDTHSEHDQVVIVWSDATTKRFSIDGRYLNGVTPCFTYRSKKVKRLKQLSQIMHENPGYEINDELEIIKIGGEWFDIYALFHGGIGGRYPANFYEGYSEEEEE
jgi:hypothetical protein